MIYLVRTERRQNLMTLGVVGRWTAHGYQGTFKALLVAVRLREAVDWDDAFFATGREDSASCGWRGSTFG